MVKYTWHIIYFDMWTIAYLSQKLESFIPWSLQGHILQALKSKFQNDANNCPYDLFWQ